ncbi:hypothetical protein LVJ83_02670 [Uruburuella testudinis]|uniref:Uncharacterized protein n=1 Tax=Uruburuella testudinis TaxID=1282863 RepID=A0ABY4DTM8_9NEIS|nr:hypothetical protein [Uruburuella testudinis]UOO82399.1 hypothetical protein LVJ83_02670 [Uruburuella testudinis]
MIFQKHGVAGCPRVSGQFVYEGIFVPENADARQKRSKIGHLARLFNAADAFSGAKYTRKSNGPNTLGAAFNIFFQTACIDYRPSETIYWRYTHSKKQPGMRFGLIACLAFAAAVPVCLKHALIDPNHPNHKERKP